MIKSRNNLLLSLLIAFLSLGAAPAFAQQQCTQTFCVRYPADWVVTVQGSTLLLRDPDGTISVELRTVTEAAQFGQARRQFENELTARCRNLRWETEPTPAQQHGMTGLVRRGRGELNGRPMVFFMMGLADMTGGVVGAGVIVQGASRQEIEIMEDVLNSIRPA